MFALSTCGWCRKTKALLKDLEVEYQCTDVDLLEGDAREQAREELAKFNPKRSFPTLVIDGEVIVGFDQDKIKKALGVG
jgi:glutaredoxin